MPLSIQFFGTFTISNGDKSVSEGDNRSKKLWKLLEYIVLNRDRHILQEELITLLWGKDALGAHAMSSLKTLMHRVRNTLDQLEFDGSRKLILQRAGSYYWNDALPCIIDTDEFDESAAKMERSTYPEEKLNCALNALALYRGHFLGDQYDEPWAKKLCEHYQALYFTCYKCAVELLANEKRFDEIIFLSRHALEIDSSQEIYYYCLISALIEKKDYEKALEAYEEVVDLFYYTYRKTPSDRLRSLYRSIVKSTNRTEMDIAIIQDKLWEDCVNGPIACEFDTFKLLYELKRSSMKPPHGEDYLILLTISGAGNERMPDGKHLDRALSRLKAQMRAALKSGDIFTRYSLTQILMIVQMKNEDALFDFLKKIQHDFKYEGQSIPVELTCKADRIRR